MTEWNENVAEVLRVRQAGIGGRIGLGCTGICLNLVALEGYGIDMKRVLRWGKSKKGHLGKVWMKSTMWVIYRECCCVTPKQEMSNLMTG